MPVLVLSNEQIRELVPIADYVNAIEAAYREFGEGRATIQPRTDLYAESPEDGRYYVFKTMAGTLANDHMVALRINSDLISWTRREKNLRKEKIPAAEGNRWVGLVFVFDAKTCELRAIMPDGEIQRRRVGATTAVAVRHIARTGARTVAIYGSGFQAEGAAYAVASVLPNHEIRLYSPNRQNREALGARCRRDGLNVVVMDSPEKPAQGADVVITATNALDAVVKWDWIAPGTLVACVKSQELGREILTKCDRIVLHSNDLDPINYMGGDREPFRDTDFVDRLFGHERGDGDVKDLFRSIAESEPPDLVDVVGGKVDARISGDERVVFLNPVGSGLQFAALAKPIIDAAEKRNVGQKLPSEWFTEDMHP